MATITFRIDDSYKELMDKHDELNWSAVARNSIIERLKKEEIIRGLQEADEDIEAGRVMTTSELDMLIKNEEKNFVDKKSK